MTYSPDKSRGSAWAGTNKPIHSAAAAAPLQPLGIFISVTVPTLHCRYGTVGNALRSRLGVAHHECASAQERILEVQDPPMRNCASEVRANARPGMTLYRVS